ncbi:hypothetical protein B0H13DRAFT_1941904 [Mycena leptocephala]|nr:hypothetical protein B0H13DRAFT_1941904 [Mycena leptocephala]
MYNHKTREWFKHVLRLSRVKLLYARITLTRYTALYFFLALLSCVLLVILQAETYASNTEGAVAVAEFLSRANVNTTIGMSFLQDGDVILCRNLPGQEGANCTTLVHRAHSHMHVRDTILSFDDSPENLQQCAISLMWLEDRREDIGILVYQIWLFSLSVVTSPASFCRLAARVLATAWAGFRLQGSKNLYDTYNHVMKGLVSNAVNLVLMAGLSYKLFTVYVSQTFSRVGASTEVNRIYKLVLLLSVVLQLAGFFTLGQTALWISKISFGAIRQLAEHFPIYLAGLIVTAVLEIPWLVLGWISVRRESKALPLNLETATLTTLLVNRFVIKEWSFYATMSVTAYILLVATFALAIVCRLQFGKGLAHFLRVADALEDGDFTPVYFSKGDDPVSSVEDDTKSLFDPEKTILGHLSLKDEKFPSPALSRNPSTLSVLFAKDTKSPGDTIHLSSTPALFSNAEKRKSASPVVVIPVTRTSSIKSNNSSPSSPRFKLNRPSDIHTGPARSDSFTLPAITAVSPMSYQHTRADSVDERPSRGRSTAEPAVPPQAVLRSKSVPRHAGLPRNPSDGNVKPAGNFF